MRALISCDRFLHDLRHAARVLLKNPGFTTVAVLSLALGIGANTAVFSVLDAVLLKSLPVRNPSQIRILTWMRHGERVGIRSHSGWGMTDEKGRSVDGSFSYPAYQAFRSIVPQFSDLVAYAPNQFTVTDNGAADDAWGHFVSGNYFTGLGVQPFMGRPIIPEDDAPARPRVAVLTYQYWNRRFAADSRVLGRVILVNRQPVTVVGVMPPPFMGLYPGRAVDLFVPMSMVAESDSYYNLAEPDNWWVQIFGRLKPDASEGAASAQVAAVLTHQIESYTGGAIPAARRPVIVLEPGSHGVGKLRQTITTSIYILAATAVFVLLIACINLANLLLARYAARAREIAIRISIGASRWGLVRQMLAESLLLAALGACAGLLISKPLLRLLLTFLAGTSTIALDARLDARALGFTFAVSLLTAVLFGAVPAWRASRAQAATDLKACAANAPGRGSRFRLGRYLVSVQIALSLVLMVGTGLFLRTLSSLAAVDLGFQSENILTFQTDAGRSGYKPPQTGALYRRLEERLSAIPGVEAVGMSHHPLLHDIVSNGPIRLPAGDGKDSVTWFLYCSDSFLSTMRIPVLLGRDFARADFDGNIRSAVVNEALVKQYLPNVNPIGQIFYRPGFDPNTEDAKPFTIVGVARNAHYSGVRDEVTPTAYLPYFARPAVVGSMAFSLRTRMAPASFAPAVRRAVASVDPNLPVAEMRTERDQIDRSLSTERLFATLVTTFGAIAILLAAIGLYGVMAFSVNRRIPEIGLRLALGASRPGVLWMILRQSLFMAALGTLVGVPSALLLTGMVRNLLYGVQPDDPLSLVGAVVAMLAVAALAAWIPARRASRVHPMVALRHD